MRILVYTCSSILSYNKGFFFFSSLARVFPTLDESFINLRIIGKKFSLYIGSFYKLFYNLVFDRTIKCLGNHARELFWNFELSNIYFAAFQNDAESLAFHSLSNMKVFVYICTYFVSSY